MMVPSTCYCLRFVLKPAKVQAHNYRACYYNIEFNFIGYKQYISTIMSISVASNTGVSTDGIH